MNLTIDECRRALQARISRARGDRDLSTILNHLVGPLEHLPAAADDPVWRGNLKRKLGQAVETSEWFVASTARSKGE